MPRMSKKKPDKKKSSRKKSASRKKATGKKKLIQRRKATHSQRPGGSSSAQIHQGVGPETVSQSANAPKIAI